MFKWLTQLFMDHPVDFDKRCRMRIGMSVGFMILGAAAVFMVVMNHWNLPVMYLEENNSDFLPQFYVSLGCAMIATGAVNIVKNNRYLKNDDLKKKRSLEETDERNRLLGLRAWAYSGYSMFLLLYLGILVSGFISVAIVKVLLAVMAVYGVNLLIFRALLAKCM